MAMRHLEKASKKIYAVNICIINNLQNNSNRNMFSTKINVPLLRTRLNIGDELTQKHAYAASAIERNRFLRESLYILLLLFKSI